MGSKKTKLIYNPDLMPESGRWSKATWGREYALAARCGAMVPDRPIPGTSRNHRHEAAIRGVR